MKYLPWEIVAMARTALVARARNDYRFTQLVIGLCRRLNSNPDSVVAAIERLAV